MRTEVIKADSIDEAADRILDELKEGAATSARSISSRNNVIYFDGWDGLGASAVLRAVAQRLTAMASSDEVPAPAGLRFDQIIHVDCSKWESRRSLQRAIAEQLGIPTPVMHMFDKQDEEDDFHGITKVSRTEIPQVLRAMLQRIQELSHRFLVIFHNGSTEEIDLGIFGFLLFGYYSTAKVLWTFQGRFRLYPRMKVDRALNKSSTETTDVFLSAVTRNEERDPQVHWSYLVRQEAADLVAAARKQVQLGDSMVSDDDDGPWRAADALQREMLIDVEHWQHNLESLPSHLVRSAESMACMPYWTSPPYEALLSPVRDMMFQQFGQLGVLKLSHCTFSFSSPPVLISSNNLRILWLDHCKDDDQVINKDRDGPEKEEDDIRQFFQRLWVLDVCYSCCHRILSARMIGLMTRLREINVVGALDWDMGQLQGRLPNIRKLRVTKSTVRCSGHHLEQDLFQGMNKMELLEFSGNRTTMQQGDVTGIPEMIISTSNSCLETVIIVHGCVGLQKFSFRGCAKLKNLLLSGLFEDLCILDLSGTVVTTVDLSAMTAKRLDEVILDNCDKLCAILWPPKGKRKRYLHKLRIGTTWSVASSTPMKENSTEGSTTTGTMTSPSASLSVVHGGREPSEFNWCIRVRDARLLRSLMPYSGQFNWTGMVHLEIYSPAAAFSSGNHNKAASSNKQQHVPLAKVDKLSIDSFVYADVEVTFEDHPLVHPSEDDAPMLTQIQMWPCPSIPSDIQLSCYTHIQDHQLSTKSLPEGIPYMIIRNALILHVHDSLSINTAPALHEHDSPALHVYDYGVSSSSTTDRAPGSSWHCLNWCRVERCPKLEHVFAAPEICDGVAVFRWLTTLWASELPEARYIWNWTPPLMSQFKRAPFQKLSLLHLDLCPRLIHVLPLAPWMVNQSLINLETLEIVWCGDLREVFPLYTTYARTTTVHFQHLKRIHLHELPKLQGICGRWRISAPELETVKIRGCWSLKRLPAVSNNTGNKVDCDCEKEWWDTLEWDGLRSNHHPSLYRPTHSRYYKKTLLKGSVLK